MNNTYESNEDYLFVWHNGCFRKIDRCEVMYLEASRNYCTIYMRNKSAYLLSITLLKASEAFPEKQFVRISRSYVVNIDCVEAIAGNTLYIQGKALIISRSYRDELFGRFRFLGSNSHKLPATPREPG